MKITIISTIYNKEDYLEEHIKSLLEQNYDNIEFIFVNDGSTDSSEKILNKYLKNKKVKIINQKNMGPNIARKTGFENSSGDYILFVDSDDKLYDNKTINNLVKVINSNNKPDCIMAQMINSYDKKDVVDECIYSPKFEEGVYEINDLYSSVFRNSLCYKLFKKSCISDEYFISERNYEDCYLSYKILNNCKNFYYLKTPIYIVNRKTSNSSLTKKFDVVTNNKKYEIIEKLILECENFKNSLNKLYFKAYLDDLNSSLSLSDENTKLLINGIKSKKKPYDFRIKNIISSHYLKLFILSYLYENYSLNINIKKIKTFLIKIKKKIRR